MSYNKDYKYIIGLDISLTGSGWAKYNVDSKELTYGLIDPGKSKDFERIALIRKEIIQKTWHESNFSNTLVLIEGYSFGSKGSSFISLAELGGILRYYFYSEGIDYINVPPTSAKKALTGSGAAGKSIILKELYKRYNIDTNDDNIADAINLCMIGRAYTKNLDKKLTKDQEKIVDSIFNPKEKKK